MVAIYSMVATFVILKVVNVFCKVRVSDADENTGLDQTQHGEVIQN